MDLPAPHLILTHEGPIPLDILEAFETAVAAEGVEVRREARLAPRTSASMTLLVSTGVGVFLTKACFDGPLNASDRSRAVLDPALRQLGRRLTALPLRRPTTSGPASVGDRYSPVFSIWTERDAESRFKMLIRSICRRTALRRRWRPTWSSRKPTTPAPWTPRTWRSWLAPDRWPAWCCWPMTKPVARSSRSTRSKDAASADQRPWRHAATRRSVPPMTRKG